MLAPSPRERGFALVAVLVGIAVMMLIMGQAASTWKYVMKDAREEELIFRGGQIADAVQRYQRKNGNALPPSLDVLVKGKYLRKAYKDPMTPDGKWRFIRQGEAMAGGGPVPGGGGRPGPGGTPTPSPSPSGFGSPGGEGGFGGQALGGFVGVASTRKEKSLRVFNSRTNYSEWLFVAGKPRIVGKQPPTPIGGTAPGQPGPGQPPGFPGGGLQPSVPPRVPPPLPLPGQGRDSE